MSWLVLAASWSTQVLTLAVVGLLTLAILHLLDLHLLHRKRNLMHVAGPSPLPVLGNALLFVVPPELFMTTLKQIVAEHGPTLRFHLGFRPNLLITSAEAFAKILSSNVHNTKGGEYRFLLDWLGLGLLISDGAKWQARRKLLTPAFHFRILEDSLQVMNRQVGILIGKLEAHAQTCASPVNICPLVALCALDIICETAMGKRIHAQDDSKTDYVRAVHACSDIVFKRQSSPWLWSDWFFALTPLGRQWRHATAVLHNFTDCVIQERKAELFDHAAEEDDIGIKRRSAFLDLLIRESKGGTVLTDEDIREEVDTFMFEGHDTVASNMAFSLFLLASHPESQRQCQAELDDIFQDSDRAATSADLARMKYLESCLKESLRLYQSVPMMSRCTGESMEIDGYHVPANTNVILINFLLHRDPKVFPNPDAFLPERFFEGCEQQTCNPYAYVPFSAGPRNCIGQKFAMMEEKVMVSSVLRHFNLQCALMSEEELGLTAEVILRPKQGIKLSFTRRSPGICPSEE